MTFQVPPCSTSIVSPCPLCPYVHCVRTLPCVLVSPALCPGVSVSLCPCALGICVPVSLCPPCCPVHDEFGKNFGFFSTGKPVLVIFLTIRSQYLCQAQETVGQEYVKMPSSMTRLGPFPSGKLKSRISAPARPDLP